VILLNPVQFHQLPGYRRKIYKITSVDIENK
jgi:hypothetical protein